MTNLACRTQTHIIATYHSRRRALPNHIITSFTTLSKVISPLRPRLPLEAQGPLILHVITLECKKTRETTNSPTSRIAPSRNSAELTTSFFLQRIRQSIMSRRILEVLCQLTASRRTVPNRNHTHGTGDRGDTLNVVNQPYWFINWTGSLLT